MIRADLIKFRENQIPTAEELDKRPEHLKDKKGLLQVEMAKRLKRSRIHWNKIERGVNEPSVELLEIFSNEFPECDDVLRLFKKC